MKNERIERCSGAAFTATLVGVITFICAPANAAHEMIYAVDTGNNLINFWSDAPANVLNSYPIAGLQSGEAILGIDWWNGQIYGLGSSSRLYTINYANGQATQVGGVFVPPLIGSTFGVDNGPSGYQVVSGLGQSLLVNRGTATVTTEPILNYVAGDTFFGIFPRMNALAYDGATGRWYAADTLQHTLAGFDPATGGLSTIGMMGIDVSTSNGMDISPFTRIMYLGTPAAATDLQANLYIMSELTGVATLVGQIGAPGADILVQGLTVVPEPGIFGLSALGALLVGRRMLARRRRQGS